jgi:hypothetical protein
MSGREESTGMHNCTENDFYGKNENVIVLKEKTTEENKKRNHKKDLTLVLYQGLFFCYSIGN